MEGYQNKVVWSEGLFLRNHHFQQQDRYMESLVRGALGAVSLQYWGFRRLELDASLLDAGQIAIVTATGIFPDGTPFRIPDAMDRPEPLPIKPDSRSGLVRLSLPVEQPAGLSIDPSHLEPSGLRYRGHFEELPDCIKQGAAPEEIEIARAVPKLLAPEDSDNGYTALAVAGVEGLQANRSVTLTQNFLPPAISSSAVPEYASWLREIVTGLERIAKAHGQIVVGDRGRGVENLLVLELANTALQRFRHMLAQDLYHPSQLYSEFSTLAGQMATYGSGSRRLAELLPYQHEDPGPGFSELMDTIRSLILTLSHIEQKSWPLPVLRHDKNIWKVRLDNPELLSARRIILRVGGSMDEDTVRRLFSAQATVAPATEFDALWRSRLPGIQLKLLNSQPREIPYDAERHCFELDRGSEPWGRLANSVGFVVGISGAVPNDAVVDCYAINR